MGLFNLFKSKSTGKEKAGTSTKKQQNHFLTNTEDFGLDKIELGISGKLRVDAILAIAEFQNLAEKQKKEF